MPRGFFSFASAQILKTTSHGAHCYSQDRALNNMGYAETYHPPALAFKSEKLFLQKEALGIRKDDL